MFLLYKVYDSLNCRFGVFWALLYWLSIPTLIFVHLIGCNEYDSSIRYVVYSERCRDGSTRFIRQKGRGLVYV